MRNDEVEIGEKYLCRVSGKIVAVEVLDRIDVGFRTGWTVTNTVSGRRLFLRSARRLRSKV